MFDQNSSGKARRLSKASHDQLTEIFKKVGSKENAKEGLQDLYEFKKKYPEADLEPYLEKTSSFFQNYIERELKAIEKEMNEKNSGAPDGIRTSVQPLTERVGKSQLDGDIQTSAFIEKAKKLQTETGVDSNKACSKSLVVGAIEIGTTLSGWAFSFGHDFKSDPTKITTSQWHIGSKTPTSALISSDGKTLVAFGYDAEEKNGSPSKVGDGRDYYYFSRFAKAFHDETFPRSLMIEDERGRKVKAVDVFSMYIAALKSDAISAIGRSGCGEFDDIYWVLTVPATLGDFGKLFMKEAATKAPASIPTGSLSIVSEAEAVSVYCNHLSEKHVVNAKQFIAKPPTGKKYMILDAGGATMDITIYEVKAARGDMQVFATTKDVGGILVDKAFENLLCEILGEEVYRSFMLCEPKAWTEMWIYFEYKKRANPIYLSGFVTGSFARGLENFYEIKTNKRLRDRIAETKYASHMKSFWDIFDGDMMQLLFRGSEYISKADTYIRSTLNNSLASGTVVIYMVGGMGSMPRVQDAMTRAFIHLNIIIPNDASTAIMRGAVIHGHVRQGTKTPDDVNVLADCTEKREPVLQPRLRGRIPKVKTRIADRDEPEQEDTKYKSIYPKRRKAIIINNENFSRGPPREGTDVDAESLEKLFTDIGFEAIRYDDLDSKDMRSKLEAVSKSGDLTESDMFVCAILTHGKEGAVCGTDNERVEIKELLKPFNGTNCKALVGKPKIFFIQACQGPEKDTGVQPDGNDDDGKDIDQDKLLNRIPIQADFFIAYSTVPGYLSLRSPRDGSLFIQALCKVLKANWRSLDLYKIMTLVNKEVAEKCVDYKQKDGKVIKIMQMPCFVSMLRKEVLFT